MNRFNKTLYLLLIIGAIWQVSEQVAGLARSDGDAQGLDMTVSQLDSFSSSAIAMIALRQGAERLMLAYARQRDPSVVGTTEPIIPTVSNTATFAPCQSRAPSTIHQMEHLRAEVQSLQMDLDGKLMIVCFDNRLWDEFLDRYKDFVQTAPESPVAIKWAPNALRVAQFRGRTEELRDTLKAIIRFRPCAKTAARFADVLSEGVLEMGRGSNVDGE
jgi:hypothetical protein